MKIDLDHGIVFTDNRNISMISSVVNKYSIKEYQYDSARRLMNSVVINDDRIVSILKYWFKSKNDSTNSFGFKYSNIEICTSLHKSSNIVFFEHDISEKKLPRKCQICWIFYINLCVA